MIERILKVSFFKLFLAIVSFSVLFSVGCMKEITEDPLTLEERAWLTEHDGKIRLGHDPNANPVDYLDKEGRFKGLAADYIRLIEKRLNFKFDILQIKTWDEVLKKAENKELDVLCAFSKSKKREQYMLFTEPYLTIPVVILTRNDYIENLTLDTMKNLKVTFTKGWVVEDYLVKNYSHLNMLPAIDSDAALNSLITHKADVWVAPLTVASIKIEATGVTNVRIAGKTDLSFKLAIASRKDMPMLHNILKKGLMLISEEEKSDIFNKWIHIRQQSIFKSKNFWMAVLIILGISVLFGIIIFSWNRTLKQKVEEKTKALENELFERIQAQDALRESESLFLQMFEQSTTSMCLYKPDGTIKRVNNEFCKMFGVKEKIIKDTGYNIFKDQAIIEAGLIPLLNNLFYEKKTEKWEINFDIDLASTSTGTPTSRAGKIFLEVFGYPVLNLEGVLEYVVLQHYDISERKQAEEELRRKENQYNAIVENSGDYIMRYDRDHRHIWANQNAIKATGLTPEQYLGKTHREMSFPEHLCKLWGKNIDEVFATGEVRRVEFDVELENDLMTLDLQFNPEFDEKGNVLSVIGVSRDITDRKTEEKRYKKTIESSFDGFWIVDRKGNFLEVNEAYSRMIGYNRNELLKMSITSIEAIEHHEETKKRIEKTIKTGSDRFESKHRHKNGHIIDVEVNAAYTHDNDGRFFVFLHDITERNQMEGRLRQSQKMESIGTLAGGIAHDFNNILFPIVGYAEMLLEDVPEDSPLRNSLKEIYTSSLRAKDLIKQILTFSRQENSELMLMKMQPIVKEALKLIRSTIPTTIEIIQDINSDCGVIKADPTQIHQIIMNLATNAYHAMEETGGELKVSLKQVESGKYDIIIPDMTPGIYACLTVADTGVGMDKNLIDKIFDPFFTTKGKGKGTGMGLSVVHGIVISTNGAIQVYSEPGKGTQFHVYFPIEKKSFVEQNIQAKEPIQVGTEQILLVDDEESILKMEKGMLERLGYQVTSRTSSLEALEAFRKNPDKFDLVITDLAMPNMAGDKLSAELTKIRPDIPVLLCTGFSETMSEEKAASLGIKGFLLKPIIMKDLAQKIREVLVK